jgi:acyl carrier protein
VSEATTSARDLVVGCLDSPHVLEGVTGEQDLLAAGVNSGELILITMECERRIGRPLSDAELSSLASIDDVARLLGREN